MGLDDFLSPEAVRFSIKARCKREALQQMAAMAAEVMGRPEEEIMRTLLEREQLGSTGVGEGVAIPHGKLDNLGKIAGFLATLEAPVNFDSVDDQPVDIIFMLLAPENATAAHLKALAKVSRLLRDPDARSALRGAKSAEALFAIATTDRKNHAA